jgi:hypothetical protein
MCWSLEASAGLAVVGTVGAVYAYRRGDSNLLWIPLLYFAGMELLQALSYPVIGNCMSSQNQLLTLLSYIHIAFQPFFVNAIFLYFIPKEVRQRVIVPVFIFCAAAALVMLVRLYPFPWAGMCEMGQILCGPQMCSVWGSWHIAWSLPLNDLLPHTYAYALAAFVLPLVYGSWRAVLFAVVTGPFLAYLSTSNVNEQPAIWCLFSVALVIVTVFTPLKNALKTKSYFTWRFLGIKNKKHD